MGPEVWCTRETRRAAVPLAATLLLLHLVTAALPCPWLCLHDTAAFAVPVYLRNLMPFLQRNVHHNAFRDSAAHTYACNTTWNLNLHYLVSPDGLGAQGIERSESDAGPTAAGLLHGLMSHSPCHLFFRHCPLPPHQQDPEGPPAQDAAVPKK